MPGPATASSSTLPTRDLPSQPASPFRPSPQTLRNGGTSSSRSLRRDREREREREASTKSEASSSRKSAAATTNGRASSPFTTTKQETKESSKNNAKSKGSSSLAPQQRIRTNPHLIYDPNAELAPAAVMYWSRAPVYGALPMRGMRAHSVTLVDNIAWLFGGCDDKGCWQDVYCFDTETLQWSHPEMVGDIPPPCRAHTATLVDKRLVIFGGGQGPVYYNSVYVLDTVTRRWTQPVFPPDAEGPAPRRAHTAVLWSGKLWVFGGGNGMQALNDLWTLEVGGPIERMRWEQAETYGKKPNPRGYHTANLVGEVMIIVGGSDGRECFSDIWCLNLVSRIWTQIKPDTPYRRLSHSSTQIGSFLFITGGHDGNKYTSELLLFDLVSFQYEPRKTLGKAPSPRGYHVSIQADCRLFIFGGFNGHDVYDDVHMLDLAGAAYLPQVAAFKVEFP
ncbi:galactose oxidase [Neolentinus lepideus HHB14362 ss-1]|uniref:Galactose oxidase n=1 Tax=Neolentinus lepideus HHB14362 ss-1 TaxID=1314782 RepID=A0A165SEE1_9AGAM|nr:galactose oxidase [Neolentinus lepideus HHB14362 ss-1]